jgi:hypothetical protein
VGWSRPSAKTGRPESRVNSGFAADRGRGAGALKVGRPPNYLPFGSWCMSLKWMRLGTHIRGYVLCL